MTYRAIMLRRKYFSSIKIICLILMIVIAAIFYFLQNHLENKNTKINFSVVTDRKTNISSTILNPKLMSKDKKNQPFTVIAEKAIQNSSNSEEILLEKVSGEIVMENKRWVFIRSDNGVLEQDKFLDLSGFVNLYTNDGYEVNTQEAHIDIASGTIESNKDVDVTGFRGKIHGTGVTITNQGNIIEFTGPVNVTLYPKK
jgi:lipopolysaccharide export system protein LptC